MTSLWSIGSFRKLKTDQIFQVYQLVRRFIDGQHQYAGPQQTSLSVTAVYEKIKRSNSSLNRKNKRLLEDSIERVLEALRQEASSSGSIDGDFDDVITEDVPKVGLEWLLCINTDANYLQVANVVNKSIVGAWSTSLPAPNGIMAPREAEKRQHPEKEQSKQWPFDEEPPKKRRKADSVVDRSPPTQLSFTQLGGMDSVIKQIWQPLADALLKWKDHTTTLTELPRGILLHGPPGCGKTRFANTLAAELGVPFIAFPAPAIVTGMSGDSEKALRGYFEEAKALAPCLMFIDEIDSITSKRDTTHAVMEKRIVTTLLTCMDDISPDKMGGKYVVVLAATNLPDTLDPALRRDGRFDKEIALGFPNVEQREHILRTLTRGRKTADDIDFRQLAYRTSGYVGADLKSLVNTASGIADRRHFYTITSPSSYIMDPNLSPTINWAYDYRQRAREFPPNTKCEGTLTLPDFTAALAETQPCAKREGFTPIPSITFADIGALKSVRDFLQKQMIGPILHPKKYAHFGISAPAGVMLWGPPGCGKTLLAQAVANAAHTNFIAASGAELMNQYVGESEKAVRRLFAKARNAAPVIIFLDEFDTLAPRRDTRSSEAKNGVINTLLMELDGSGKRNGIYLLAATNRPLLIDPAMLRSGRLEAQLYVGLPGREERVEILHTLVENLKKRAPKVVSNTAEYLEGIAEVARACEGLSGADLAYLLKNAQHEAVFRVGDDEEGDAITLLDFQAARDMTAPSVQEKERQKYEKWRQIWKDRQTGMSVKK